jgi:hypothetical protein
MLPTVGRCADRVFPCAFGSTITDVTDVRKSLGVFFAVPDFSVARDVQAAGSVVDSIAHSHLDVVDFHFSALSLGRSTRADRSSVCFAAVRLLL